MISNLGKSVVLLLGGLAIGALAGPDGIAPVKPLFVALTLAAALFGNLLPPGDTGLALRPDFLALTLVFWNVRQPRQLGFGLAFLFGLLMDIHEGALLGEHALAYSLLSWGAIALHRRVPWFDLAGRMMHVLVLMSALLLALARVPGLLGMLSSLPGC